MAELRKDPILGDWVIMAPDRATRPFDHDSNDDSLPPEPCPFCRGNEAATPEAVLTVADDKTPDDWTVRIIPNRYPAVMVSPSANIDQTPEFFERTAARGYHEVIIESPSHHQAMRELSVEQCFRVVRAWRDRLSVVGADETIAHTMIFKNEGAAAGASLEHVHSQLLATSFIPARIEAELDAGKKHFEQTSQNLWTEMLDGELSAGSGIVSATDEFVLLCPFASRFPGEMCLFPCEPSPSFETETDSCLRHLAATLLSSLACLNKVFPQVPFNLSLHTAPPRDPRRDSYYWHLAVTPRLTGIAGFELGSGSWINVITPEDAATRYRACFRT